MRATPFLSYAVDPGGPWDGIARHVESLDAMPGGAAAGGMHLFHLVAHGVAEDRVQVLEEVLGQRLHSVATVHYDRVTRRWQGEALMEAAHLEQSCLGIPLSIGEFDVPWVHVDAREASVRLLPRMDPDLYVLHARLEKALRRDVSVTYLDFREYKQWLRRLHAAA